MLYPNKFYEYILMTIGCAAALPPEEKRDLEKWEHENLGRRDVCLGTTDWPGWIKYIGPPPVPEPRIPQKRIGRVYLIRNEVNGFVKIGFSVQPDLREKTLQAEEPTLVLIGSIAGTVRTEHALHNAYADQRIRGEWFNLTETDIREILD
jgi:hypothetical protein